MKVNSSDSDPAILRWLPGLFLMNDFLVPGAAIKQGRWQEPCTDGQNRRPILSYGPPLLCRRPPSVRGLEGETAKPSLGPAYPEFPLQSRHHSCNKADDENESLGGKTAPFLGRRSRLGEEEPREPFQRMLLDIKSLEREPIVTRGPFGRSLRSSVSEEIGRTLALLSRSGYAWLRHRKPAGASGTLWPGRRLRRPLAPPASEPLLPFRI